MPKKVVSKIMLSPAKLEQMRAWGWIGKKLFARDLWHLNRKTVGLAFLNGLFWACMPMPFQMVGAAITALIVRCNVPISTGLCWLTNPITMPPYFVFAYSLGAWILSSEPLSLPPQITTTWIHQQLSLIWWPLLTGSLVIGVTLGALGFLGLRFWWKWQVNYNWTRRKGRFLKRRAVGPDVAQTDNQSERPPDDRGSQ